MKRIYRFLSACLCAALACCWTLAFAAGEQTVHADIRSPWWVIVKGTQAGFVDDQQGRREAIAYENMVYIPLATVGLWMGADARWDADTNAVTITSNAAEPVYYRPKDLDFDRLDLKRPEGDEQYQLDMKNGIDVLLCPDVTVTVDGQIKTFVSDGGTPLCPLLFRECIYLPVSGAAQLLGLKALWLEQWNTVDVYDPDALEAIGTYVTALRGHLDDVRMLLEKNYALDSDEEFVEYMGQIRASVQAIQSLPEPPDMTWYLDAVSFYTQHLLSDDIEPYLPLNAIASDSPYINDFWKRSPDSKWRMIKETLISKPKDVTSNFLSLEKICTQCEDLLSCAGTNVFFCPDPGAGEVETPAIQPGEVVVVDPTRFTDSASIANWDAVSTLCGLGVISGKENGCFDPGGTVTRAEAAKMIVLMSTGGREPDIPADPVPLFSDIHGHWAEGYINFGSMFNILDGGGDGSFDPDGEVTGIQFAKLCLGMLGYDPAVYQLTGSAWASHVDALVRHTVPDLYEELEAVDMNAPISRENAAQMLYNALGCYSNMRTFSESGRIWEYKPSDRTFLQEYFQIETLPEVPAQPGK
ncbi:S-layer homology domain-containing protein [Vermiculatibacterium agrestimuris]|uniref:S-layer homology domain-containing protein n=1 Tax=Vermiculatibacterium agrestimuris TaxID=2941519 RepID=UPI00203F3012|nr:S-layer homology domain-containing protein [Vermiculatibacterium agrestimuris]